MEKQAPESRERVTNLACNHFLPMALTALATNPFYDAQEYYRGNLVACTVASIAYALQFWGLYHRYQMGVSEYVAGLLGNTNFLLPR